MHFTPNEALRDYLRSQQEKLGDGQLVLEPSDKHQFLQLFLNRKMIAAHKKKKRGKYRRQKTERALIPKMMEDISAHQANLLQKDAYESHY